MKLETNHRKVMEYIRMRGYASFSTLKTFRDGGTPGNYISAPHFDHGTELHSRWLEHTRITKYDPEVEAMLRGMERSLNRDKVATMLLKGAQVEVEFNVIVHGVMTHGFIDILPPKLFVGDLKTTSLTTRKAFIDAMDFLQAALYLLVTKRKDFYFIGVCKKPPYEVFTFRVSDYPERMKEAHKQLKELLTYVKKNY